MVVASPCPLLIAAPVAMVSGMSSMSRSHIIVKSGTTLEKLSRTLTFAFDKTGTLTENQLVIDQVVLAKDSSISKEELQGLAASVEQQSSHVIATSLVKSTDKNLIKPVTNLKEATAKGVSGEVDGKLVKVGNLPTLILIKKKSQFNQQLSLFQLTINMLDILLSKTKSEKTPQKQSLVFAVKVSSKL